jgi:hypothetical protein
MMTEDGKENLWIGMSVGIALGSIIWAFGSGVGKSHSTIMEEAIANGCAGFNRTTGEFEFNKGETQ